MDNATAKSLSFQSVSFALLSYYSLEPEQYPQPLTKGRLLGRWLQTYPEQWVRCALIESLYQGRYKTYCVEQILALWHRRGQPIYHFNHEFETMICNNVPQRQENVLAVNEAMADRADEQGLQPVVEGLPELDLFSPSEAKTEVPQIPAVRPEIAQALKPELADAESMSPRYWENAFEAPITDGKGSVLSEVLSRNQLLPLMFNRMGLVPIHRFMPEAEPVEFCEKLAAIASACRTETR